MQAGGGKAYVGFTASTGVTSASVDVKDWMFCSRQNCGLVSVGEAAEGGGV